MDHIEKIIFVYNADSGLFSTVSDFAHKIISPDTYECNLCKLTYGNIMMKKEWKEFLDSLDAEKTFKHRNEFLNDYPQFKDTALPCIFVCSADDIRLIVSAEEINALEDVSGLKNMLAQKLEL